MVYTAAAAPRGRRRRDGGGCYCVWLLCSRPSHTAVCLLGCLRALAVFCHTPLIQTAYTVVIDYKTGDDIEVRKPVAKIPAKEVDPLSFECFFFSLSFCSGCGRRHTRSLIRGPDAHMITLYEILGVLSSNFSFKRRIPIKVSPRPIFRKGACLVVGSLPLRRPQNLRLHIIPLSNDAWRIGTPTATDTAADTRKRSSPPPGASRAPCIGGATRPIRTR